MTRRLFNCAVCQSREDRHRTCAGCGRWVCLDCIGGRPQRCLECTAAALEGTLCSRTRCQEPAVELSWRFLDGRACNVQGLCRDHAEAKSHTYSLRLIHRPGKDGQR